LNVLLLLAALQAQAIPPLPDSSGWGVHVLAIARAPDSAIWIGTYGKGIFVFRKGVRSGEWERIRSSSDTAAHSISWDFVHAFGFGPRGQIWYGTVGNGWGLSTDAGRTWKNWEFGQLGPEWQYVTPDGIRTRGDTTYIATADGIKLTWDDGLTWRVITDSIGATTAKDSVWGRIPDQYVLWLRTEFGPLLITYPSGGANSSDGGRTWTGGPGPTRPEAEREEARAFRGAQAAGLLLTLCSDRRVEVPNVTLASELLFGTPWGLLGPGDRQGCATVPRAGVRVSGSRAPIQSPRHTWFRRPIALEDQPYIDQTYRFGSTMGGNFQPHQGVEFNNGNGTPVRAIGDGVVVHSGPAERGALTVAIKHDARLTTHDARLFVFSVYYHNSQLLAPVGRRVKAGDVIALVGNTGRATNDHLHLEVHASPFDSTRLIVDPEVRYPPYNTNPELWIDPLPGTGMIAGQVWDSAGKPVPQARIYGLVKAEPRETPFSFIETYGPRNHPDPVYQEHFAISDVSPGTYVLGVEIAGKRVFREVKVDAGKLTWVEFRP
jgi:murein DD-endopeptidase MepM/ murein hydrolase activator NlpD